MALYAILFVAFGAVVGECRHEVLGGSQDRKRPSTEERWQRAYEAAAADFGISVPEFKRRLAIELEVKAAHEQGLPEWQIDAIRACPTGLVQDIRRDNQAPTGPSSAGIIPSSQQMSNVRGSNAVRTLIAKPGMCSNDLALGIGALLCLGLGQPWCRKHPGWPLYLYSEFIRSCARLLVKSKSLRLFVRDF